MQVYCDESCISGENFFGIGGLWLPMKLRRPLAAKLQEVKDRHSYMPEMKWGKVSTGKIELYEQFVKVFFDYADELSFNCIIVKDSEVSYSNFHGAERDLGFRKFYYLLLSRRMLPGQQYYLSLDDHPRMNGEHLELIRRSSRQEMLRRHRQISPEPVKNIEFYDSSREVIGQLADVLLGATTASWNEHFTNLAKLHILNVKSVQLRKPNLRFSSLPSERKFNIWFWNARSAAYPR